MAITIVDLRATAATLSALSDNVHKFMKHQHSRHRTSDRDSPELVQDLIDLMGAVDLGTCTNELTRSMRLSIKEYVAKDKSGQAAFPRYNPNNRFVVLDRRNRAGYSGLNAEVAEVLRDTGLMDFYEVFDVR